MPKKKSLDTNPGGTAVAEPEELTPELPTAETTPAATPIPQRKKILEAAAYKGMSIWQALERMNDDDWSDKMLYVLRVAPMTTNSATGEKYGSQLKGYYPKFNKADLESMLGGGRFKLWLNTTAGGNLKIATEEIPGAPKLLENEVLKSRSEEKTAAAPAPSGGMDLNGVKDLLRMFLEAQRQERVEAGDETGASALSESIKLVASGAAEGQRLIVDASKAPTLTDQLTTVRQLMEIATPKQDDTTKLLIKTLIERSLPAAGPVANPINQMKEAFETMKSAKELFGEAEAAASGDWKSTLVAALAPAIPQIIQTLRALSNRPPQVIVMQPGPNGQMIQVPQRATPQTLDTVPLDAGSAGVPPAPEVSAPSVPPSVPSVVNPAGADLLTGDPLKLRVVTMFLKGKDGGLVASFVEDVAPTVYNGLRQIDAGLFPGFLKNDPILAQIATEPGFDEWCKEFLEYMHEEEEEGEGATAPQTPTTAPVQ